MRVAIFYNKEDRELRSFLYLETLIKKNYPHAKVLITGLFHPGFMRKLLAFQPDVILGYPLTSRGLAKHYYLLKAIFNCKIILYRTEGIITKSGGDTSFHLGYEEYGPQLVDGELFWGQRQQAVVAPLLLEKEKLSSPERTQVAGYLRYETLLCAPYKLPEEFGRQISSHTHENIVTFITGFQFADYSEEDMIRSGDLFDPSTDNAQTALDCLCLVRDRLKVYRERWIQAIIDTAYSNPDCLVVVKPHPVELELWQEGVVNPYASAFCSIKNILFIEGPCSTESLIAASLALVHYGSTCVAETYLLGKYSIEATAEDLMTELRSNEYIISYGSLGWPSNTILPVEDVARFITDNKKKLLSRYVCPPGVEFLLRENFNLSLGVRYMPSQIIMDSIFNKNTFSRQNINNSIIDLRYLYRYLYPLRGSIICEGMKVVFHALFKGEWKRMVNLILGGSRLFLLMCKGFNVRR